MLTFDANLNFTGCLGGTLIVIVA